MEVEDIPVKMDVEDLQLELESCPSKEPVISLESCLTSCPVPDWGVEGGQAQQQDTDDHLHQV